MGIFKERALLLMFASALLMGVEGCTYHYGDFTMLSTKHVDLSGVKRGFRGKGEDCVTYVLLVPDRAPRWPNIEAAMDQAIENGQGDILIDPVVTQFTWTAYIVSQDCIIVEGTVAQTALYKPKQASPKLRLEPREWK
ncbi:MAG: hypothetical protein HP497_05150 [Nitrospira sp.]|nr:hypothetical protein [Nitrospira sp.]